MSIGVKSIIGSYSGLIVDVECHLSNNLPAITIIGVASKSVGEAKDRLRAAFTNSGVALPKKHITLNLSPADLAKDTASVDLAMAVSILLISEQIPKQSVQDSVFIGELGLDGSLKPVRGLIGNLLTAKKHNFKRVFLPMANEHQAKLVEGLEIIPISSLNELYLHLSEVSKRSALAFNWTDSSIENNIEIDFADINGQAPAKRALEIAAAGGHNCLLFGAPGVGKTMLAKALPGILPSLSREEVLEVTQIHSLHSQNFESLITQPPFRSPHHSASISSMVGGGSRPLPGEVSLAHKGVLFLDEISEFSRSALESLRQPMEDGRVNVSRVRETVSYPCRFLLVATQNPCPCGYFGIDDNKCSCQASAIAAYQRKLSGPLLDRIDLFVETSPVDHQKLLLAETGAETSAIIAKRVALARQKQIARTGEGRTNSTLSNREIRQMSTLTTEAKDFLNQAGSKLGLSARSYFKTVKVARTIADLADQEDIKLEHLAEALQYRYQNASHLLTSVV